MFVEHHISWYVAPSSCGVAAPPSFSFIIVPHKDASNRLLIELTAQGIIHKRNDIYDREVESDLQLALSSIPSGRVSRISTSVMVAYWSCAMRSSCIQLKNALARSWHVACIYRSPQDVASSFLLLHSVMVVLDTSVVVESCVLADSHRTPWRVLSPVVCVRALNFLTSSPSTSWKFLNLESTLDFPFIK